MVLALIDFSERADTSCVDLVYRPLEESSAQSHLGLQRLKEPTSSCRVQTCNSQPCSPVL